MVPTPATGMTALTFMGFGFSVTSLGLSPQMYAGFVKARGSLQTKTAATRTAVDFVAGRNYLLSAFLDAQQDFLLPLQALLVSPAFADVSDTLPPMALEPQLELDLVQAEADLVQEPF